MVRLKGSCFSNDTSDHLLPTRHYAQAYITSHVALHNHALYLMEQTYRN